MEFRLLGPLDVVADDGTSFGVDARKPRALLVLLLLDANEIVPAERLIEELWGDRAPPSASKLVQTYVSQLRRALGRDRIVTRTPGYMISIVPDELDLERFERLRVSQPRDALELWRGAPLADFAYESWAQPEIARLTEARLGALEDRIDLDLAATHHAELIAELEELVDEHPHRERLRRQLMLALYRCGRHAEALATYRDGRRRLVEELGIEPSAPLQQLERSILCQDPGLDVDPGRDAIQPERLIGRETPLLEVAELLAGARLTTLTGPGGIGKTRLALEAARRAAEGYADGVVIVELAALGDPDLVAVEVARSLGVPQPNMTALVGYLRTKEQLLVLDNFEQVAAAASILEELLDGAPRLSLLVTSRVPLHLRGEARYAVPPLELPDMALAQTQPVLAGAVELFVQRAREQRPEFELVEENATAVAELCVRLDGLPLALELAAARVSLLSPGAILARLGRRLDMFRTTDQAVPERHRTLRAAIAWSHDLLSPGEQDLFGALAVFSGGFSADAAETVIAGSDVLDRLGALLDSSLVRPERSVGDEPRFGMLETIRDYALERLAERDDVHEVRRRHALFYRDVAEQAEPGLRGPRQVAWLRRLDAERENLRAALQFAIDDDEEAELGLRTAASLWRYWQIRGGLEEGGTVLRRLLGSSGDVAPSIRARGLAAASRVAFAHGELDASEAYGEESLALEHELDGGSLRPFSLIVLAMVSLARQDIGRANELLAESIGAADESGDWFIHSMALMIRGDFLYAAGELDAARHNLEEAVRAAREIGDLRNIARGLSNLGMVGLAQLDWERATRLFEEALMLQRELGDRWGIPRTLVALGVAAHGRGDAEQSHIFFDQGLRLQLEADDRPGLASSFEEIAALATDAHDHEGAARLFGAAAILRELVGRHPLSLPSRHTGSELEATRRALSEVAFADAWSRGRSMTLDEAVLYALERTRRNEDVRYAIH